MRHACQLDPIDWDSGSFDMGACIRASERAAALLAETGGNCHLESERCPCGYTVYGPDREAGKWIEEHLRACPHPDLEPLL